MTDTRHTIAPRYAGGYHPIAMKRVLGLFVYHEERTCPLCGSPHVHRTKRGRFLEFWILLLLPVRPYRCGKCRLLFYGPKQLAKIDDVATPGEAD